MTGRTLAAIGLAAACIAAGGVARVVTYDTAGATLPIGALPVPSMSPAAAPSPAATTPAPEPSKTAPRRPYALPAPAAYPEPCPVARKPGRSPYVRKAPKVLVPDAALPAPLPVAPRAAKLDAIRGKGWWIYQMRNTEGGSVPAIVARAKAAGLTQIWVRTGSSINGFYGHEMLPALLPAAHAAGIQVLAWDFPYLHDPVADAARAVEALNFVAPGGHRIDGFSPDIETAGEGTIASALRAKVYLSRITAAAGDRPIVATIPRITAKRLATFPYAAMAPYVDAYAPMVYWSCNEPGQLAAENLRFLAKFRPVHLIGQSYDMGVEGGRPGDPRGAELWRFLDVGRAHGAVGVSFYAWHTATAEQFTAVGAYPWGAR